MQFDVVVSLIREFCSGDLEFGVDFVDDCSRATSALIVHRRNFLLAPSLLVVLEDYDLRILSAQLDDGIDLGVKFFDRQRDSMHLLNKLRTDHLRDGSATGAGDEDACILRRNSSVGFHAAQEFEDLFRLTGLMTLVILPDGLVGRGIDHNRFNGCRTYVQAN